MQIIASCAFNRLFNEKTITSCRNTLIWYHNRENLAKIQQITEKLASWWCHLSYMHTTLLPTKTQDQCSQSYTNMYTQCAWTDLPVSKSVDLNVLILTPQEPVKYMTKTQVIYTLTEMSLFIGSRDLEGWCHKITTFNDVMLNIAVCKFSVLCEM